MNTLINFMARKQILILETSEILEKQKSIIKPMAKNKKSLRKKKKEDFSKYPNCPSNARDYF